MRSNATGSTFIPIGLTPPVPEDADFGWVLWELPKQLAPGIAASLTEWGADLAVVDAITVPGWFAADLAGVPRVEELVPHGLQLPSKHLPPPGTGLAPGRTPIGWLRDSVMRKQHLRSYEIGMAACRASRESLGLPPEGPPVATLVATLPGLEGRRGGPAGTTYVTGPMEWDPSLADLPAPPGEGPLVFLTDSSAGGRAQTLLAAAASQIPELRVACTRFGSPVPGLPETFVAGPGGRHRCWTRRPWWSARAGTGWWRRRWCAGCRWSSCPARATSGRTRCGWPGSGPGSACRWSGWATPYARCSRRPGTPPPRGG